MPLRIICFLILAANCMNTHGIVEEKLNAQKSERVSEGSSSLARLTATSSSVKVEKVIESKAKSPRQQAVYLRRETRRLLKAESSSEKNNKQNVKTIKALVKWVSVLRKSDVLTDRAKTEYYFKVKNRLVRVKARLEKDALRKKESLAKQPKRIVPPPAIIAQQGVGAGLGNGLGRGGNPFGNQNADLGESLIDLIQTVIAPGSWDINGGPGSIYYYPPLRVMVVGAP